MSAGPGRPDWPRLPVDAVLPALAAALAGTPRAVLVAPPGAGKTTRVPLALLGAPWLDGRRILMLEPRRIAARAAAGQMARLLGEPVGATVGYRTRFDSRIGPATRIEIVTEGILTRMVQDDPELADVGAVVFDEFHERSLAGDLGLALVLDVAGALRPDLRLLVMSATLDAARVADLLDGAPVIESAGRSFPVETVWRPPAAGRQGAAPRIEDSVARAVREALAAEEGSLLVFLPGGREIREVAARLGGLGPAVEILPLHGDLPPAAQDAAIRPAPAGKRKVVLSTNVAETSVTIDGVRVVIDSGLARAPRFDPRTGMSRLETVRISRAEADQRRGRAGRTAPGVCWRLWAREAEGAMPLFATPEILATDLAPLALELAVWGADPATLRWLDPPPPAAHAEALSLLRALGAVDADGRATAHGRRLARLPAHPRLAHMLVEAERFGRGGLAAALAALLDGRRPAEAGGTDLRRAVEVLRADPALAATRRVAEELHRRAGRTGRLEKEAIAAGEAGAVLALAYPDRVAQRRPGGNGAYRLSSGRGAVLPPGDPLADEPFLVVADIDDRGRDGRIRAAAPIEGAKIETLFADRIETVERVAWDDAAGGVVARRERRFGALLLEEGPIERPDPGVVAAAVIDGLRAVGLGPVWSEAAEALRARVVFARRLEGEAWPDWSDAALLASLPDWLGAALSGVRRRADLAAVDAARALAAALGRERMRALDLLAPAAVTVPSGRQHSIDYSDPAAPVLPVRLQEMFGAASAPRIGGGRVPLTLHLLSPAGRPLQVTRDLGAFWSGSYAAVRREMRGRYPKHPWPENPLEAPPTARAKPRGQ